MTDNLNEGIQESAAIQEDRERRVASTFYLRIAVISVALIVGLGVVGQFGINAVTDAPVQTEPIQSSVLLCPDPGVGAQAGSRMTAAVVPGQAGQDKGDGKVVVTTLTGTVSDKAKLTAPGAQTEIAGRAVAGRQTRVVLVNPDAFAAVIDLVIYGPNGVIDAPGGRGLVVNPKQRMYVRLDALAPGVPSTAIHVIARTGRIGASVDDDQMSGLHSVGTEWVPRAVPPAKKVYVPGVFPGKGVRVLAIAAPGDADAQVSIRVMTKDGTFQPAERDHFTVPSDSVISLDMSSVTQGQPATLELTSDTPIVAGMRQFYGSKKVQNDTAYSAGAQVLNSTSAESGMPVQGATSVRLALTAPKGDAKVNISLLPYLGKDVVSSPVQVQEVTIAAGSVQWLPITLQRKAAWFTIMVTPLNDQPYLVAHQVLERSSYGDLVTGYPWQALHTEVKVPTAHEDPGLPVRK